MITIGKLAAHADVSTDTLRYYERERLLKPSGKSTGGYRLFDDEALRRVRFIKQAQQCGFSLGEIRALLLLRSRNSACCSDVRKLAIEKKLQIESKVRAMKAMSKTLDGLIAHCEDDAKPLDGCPILAAFDDANGATAANAR
jgi:DNA-binding transcriptional MerR regulator